MTKLLWLMLSFLCSLQYFCIAFIYCMTFFFFFLISPACENLQKRSSGLNLCWIFSSPAFSLPMRLRLWPTLRRTPRSFTHNSTSQQIAWRFTETVHCFWNIRRSFPCPVCRFHTCVWFWTASRPQTSFNLTGQIAPIPDWKFLHFRKSFFFRFLTPAILFVITYIWWSGLGFAPRLCPPHCPYHMKI